MLFYILKLDESRVIIWKSSSGRVRYQPRLLTNKNVTQIHTGAWVPQPISMFAFEEEDPYHYKVIFKPEEIIPDIEMSTT